MKRYAIMLMIALFLSGCTTKTVLIDTENDTTESKDEENQEAV